MGSQPQSARIPWLEVSGKVDSAEPVAGLPPGLKHRAEVEIAVTQALPEACYALDIVKRPAEGATALGIFGPCPDLKAQDGVYAVGLVGREPLICTLVKDESQAGSVRREPKPQVTSTARVNSRRKSFMTPTPLHIPESRVSPIPDSAHERIYLKPFEENASLMVLPLEKVIWMHPLILIVEKPEL